MKITALKVKPVKKYANPKYPTIKDAQCAPLLLKKLPSRWEKNAKVIAAMGLLGAMTLTSCGILEPKNNDNAGTENNNPVSENYLNVAPLFIHGEGTGAMGCVMIVPAVFLSEQEAYAIILSETESAGLNLNTKRHTGYTATQNESAEQWGKENKYALGDGNVGLDMYDIDKQIGVAYISMNAAEKQYLPDKDGNQMMSSVTEYLPRELAELSVDDFAKQHGDITVGVFYDPGRDWENEEHQRILEEFNNSEKDWAEKEKQYEKDTKAVIEEDLREQVRDFIEWLQAQGII